MHRLGITLALAAACIATQTARLHAVEVSLEENKAQRGNIGFVDMQAVFRKYPETQKAKQNFSEVVRQAEEQVDTKKAELISLRAELARLKMERDFLAKTPAIGAAKPKPSPDSGVATSTEATPSTATASALPGMPGMAPAAPAASGAAAQPLGAAQTAQLSLQEMAQKIADEGKTLQTKEAEFGAYEAQVEKNLFDLENRRTEILLGRIYTAVQAVAHKNGISVVVDKSQILFGQKAVDLTEKVLEELQNEQQ